MQRSTQPQPAISVLAPEKPSRFLGPLGAMAKTLVLVAAAGSVSFMLLAGSRNQSWVLMMLFALWVLSPFLALAFAERVSKRWSLYARTALHGVMLVVALVSLVVYGKVALGPLRAQTAFVFVVIPPASWLLFFTVVPVAAWIAARKTPPFRSES